MNETVPFWFDNTLELAIPFVWLPRDETVKKTASEKTYKRKYEEDLTSNISKKIKTV